MPASPNPFAELELSQLRRRRNLKWQTYGPDVLPLWVAEMDLGWAEVVREAVTEAIEAGDVGYPAGTDYPEAFIDFADRRWGWAPQIDQCWQVNDVMTGVVEVLRVLTGPGDPVIITPPVYPPFAMAVDYLGRTVVPAALTESGRLDLSTLEEALDRTHYDGARAALLLANPHNPTGVAHTAAELAEVAALADRHGARVVVDEIHGGLVHEGATFVPYLSVPGTESAVIVTSAAKSWNLQGLKAALMVAGPAAVADLRQMSPLVDHGYASLGTVGHAAAFRHGEAWLDEVRGGLAANRALLDTLMTEHLPEVGYRSPEATYLAWLDCRPLGLEQEPKDHFLEHAGVALSGGPDFGAAAAGFVRLNFATSPEVLELAVRRMAESFGA